MMKAKGNIWPKEVAGACILYYDGGYARSLLAYYRARKMTIVQPFADLWSDW